MYKTQTAKYIFRISLMFVGLVWFIPCISVAGAQDFANQSFFWHEVTPPYTKNYAQNAPIAQGQLIIKLKPSAGVSSLNHYTSANEKALARISIVLQAKAQPLHTLRQGNTGLKKQIGLDRTFLLYLPAHISVEQAINTLATDPDVEYAEPDFIGAGAEVGIENGGLITPNDKYWAVQWGLNNTGQLGGKVGADIRALDVWSFNTGVSNTRIAVLDTGIDLSHPEFSRKIVGGYDFVNKDDLPLDDHGHGSHVAGVVAALSNNALGVTGICWECRLLAVKVLDADNRGLYSNWMQGIEYAVDHGAQVINMSMGGVGNSLSLQDAVRYAYFAQVPIIAAMMNEGTNMPYYPAALPEAIAIGMTNRLDQRDKRSSYGSHIHLVAPGVDIYSTFKEGTYANMTGTSMAAPHVTGVVGLIRSIRNSNFSGAVFTVEHIRHILQFAVDDQVGAKNEDVQGWDVYFGYGRLNAKKALDYAMRYQLQSLSLEMSDVVPARAAEIASVELRPITAVETITYTWSATDLVDFVDVASVASSNATLTWQKPGAKVITVTASNGVSIVTVTKTIEVFSTMQAAFEVDPPSAQGTAPFTVSFHNTSSGQYIKSFWDFGDGATSNETHPTHTYTNTGAFWASLMVVDDVDVSSISMSALISVTAPFSQPETAPTPLPTITETFPANLYLGLILSDWVIAEQTPSPTTTPIPTITTSVPITPSNTITPTFTPTATSTPPKSTKTPLP